MPDSMCVHCIAGVWRILLHCSSCLHMHIQQKQIYCRQSNLPYTTHVPHSPAQFCRYGVVGGKRVGWSLNVRDVSGRQWRVAQLEH